MTTPYPETLFQDTEKEQRQRIALTVANAFLITGTMISLTVLYIAISLKSWHMFALYGGNVLYLVLTYLGLKQIRQNNIIRGVFLTSGAIHLTIALLPILFAGISTVVGLFSMLVSSLIISQTLDVKIARRAIPISVFAGIFIILLGALPISFRIPIPSILVITVAILAVLETAVFIVIIWRQFRTYNIQTKLLLAFVTMLVISLLFTAGYNAIESYRIQRAQISTNLTNDLIVKRTTITNFLEAARHDVAFLGEAEVLHSYIKTIDDIAAPNIVLRTRTVVEREFRRFAESRGIYEEIRFLNNNGNEILRIDTSLDGISSIVSQSELRTADKLDPARDLSYFTQAQQLPAGGLFESSLSLNVEDGRIENPHEPIIQFGSPLVINTQTKGVILANIYAEKFLGILSASGANTFLVDTDGYYIYHPDKAKRWGRDLKTNTKISGDFPDLIGNLYSGNIGSMEANGYLIIYAPVKMPNETTPRWYIGTFVSIDSITKPIFESTYTSVSLLLLTIIAAIFIMTYLSSTITSPLGNLAMAAQDVAAGKLSARVNIETNDEVGTLAKVFNSMANQLQGLVTSLEIRVSERTAELEREKYQSDTRARQFEAITKVARAISATRNLQELLPQISVVISKQFDFYHVGIFLNDQSDQMAILSAANSEGGQKMLHRNHQLKIGEQGIVGHVIKTGVPLISLDVGADAHYFDNPDLPETHSEMALPLKTGDKIIGALDIQSTKTGAFTDEDFGALSALADQVSLAIQNARYFDESDKKLSEANAIQRQATRETWNRLPKEEKLSGYRYSIVGANPLTEDELNTPQDDPTEKRTVKVPISLRGEIIGTLSVQIPKTEHFTSDQNDLIKAVAERVALSAENARLFEETTRRADQERIIADITSKIGTSVRTENILRTTAMELSQLLDNADVFIELQTAKNKEKDAS